MLRELKRRAEAGGAGPTVAGLILIAPAVDFTERLMWEKFPPKVKREILEKGAWERPSAYSERPYLITRTLIEEGRQHLLLGGMIEPGCPVRILQGVADPRSEERSVGDGWRGETVQEPVYRKTTEIEH